MLARPASANSPAQIAARGRATPGITRLSVNAARFAAIVIALIAISALVGWALDVPVLRRVLPNAVEMKANTAIALLLLASALFIFGNLASLPARRWRQFGRVLAMLGGLLAAATLGQYAFGWEMGIDEFLFGDTSNVYNSMRGRMSPYSALALVCGAVALVMLPRPGLRPLAQGAAALVTGIGIVSCLGYFWNATEIITDRVMPPVAVHTGVAFVLLGGGIMFAAATSASRRRRRSALAPVERKIVASFIGALLLLSASGAWTYRAAAEYATAARWVWHAQEVRAVLSHLDADIANAESAQRNYLLTGQRGELERFNILAEKITNQQTTIGALLVDAEQMRKLIELRLLVERFMSLLNRGVDLYQQQGFEAARALVATGQGFGVMRSIRDLTDRMDSAEQILLSEREGELLRSRQRTLVALLLTMLVAGGIFAFVFRAIHHEIEARSDVELALVRAKEAADLANRAKSTFLATMSHEIRTPMNGVLGMLQLLSMSKLDGEQRTKLEIMRESGKSLLRIIDDILDFSKIEAQRLDLRPEPASVGKMIQNTCNLFIGSAGSKDVRLDCSTDPRISPVVMADPIRIQQILNNLVSNALKFTPKGGTVEVKAVLLQRVDGETGQQEQLLFSVRDTGIGISPENQQRLFKPFTQGDIDTTRLYGGTGLGLSICQRLAEMMGGSVTMASALGAGTTVSFVVTLPIADPAALPKTEPADKGWSARNDALARRDTPSSAQAETEGSLVLIVDDHSTNRMLILRQVQMLGYAAESAENGVSALQKWQTGRFGAVITDCNMPVMDGYELARSIRHIEARTGSPRVPIIACTANAMGGSAELCYEAGMDDFLTKPIELEDLFMKLDQWRPIKAAPGEVETTDVMPAPRASGAVVTAAAAASPAGTLAGAPIDRAVLDEVFGDDPKSALNVLLDFRRVKEEDTVVLKQAVAQNDMAAVTRASHRIKGASMMVGAVALAGVCERIEQASRRNNPADVAVNMSAFDQECMRLSAYFESL